MAIMVPNTISHSAPDSERKVFERLREGLPDSWTVIHGRRFVLPAIGQQRAFEGEVDFLVINPTWGYLGLEVKGGLIVRGPTGWISTDRNGRENPIRDPGRQAQAAVHGISKYLRAHARHAAWASTLQYGWGVVFPDVSALPDLGADLPRQLVLDQNDLRDPQAALGDASRYFSTKAAVVTAVARKGFIAALAPSFHLASSLTAQLEEERAALVRLSEEQVHVLDTLADVQRLAVKGAAGTGKTLVAIEKARRDSMAGRRVLLLCYNRHLAASLARASQGVAVRHFHGLCRDLALAAGHAFDPPSEAMAARAFWDTEAPQVMIQALRELPDERYDTVVVDEGQDFLDYWWLAIEHLLRAPQLGRLWVFFDPNQNLYGGGSIDALGLVTANLVWNCRNTTRIANYSARAIGISAVTRPGAPEGAVVEELLCDTEQQLLLRLRERLHRLTNEERMSPSRIVVLSPHTSATSSVWRQRTFGNLSLVEFPNPPGPNEISFATLQSFKGLEADAIFLCEVRNGDPGATPRHLYVGTSRARHLLIVLKLS